MGTTRTILSHTGPAQKVRQGPVRFTVATPNGAIKLEHAAHLLQVTVEDMRELARREQLWYVPPITVYSLKTGIRGKYLDADRFDRYMDKQQRKLREAESFKANLTRDLGD